MEKKGLISLAECLIAVGLIAFLAVLIYFASDPPKRFIEARNAERWTAVNSILNGYLNYKFDHQGAEAAVLANNTYYLLAAPGDDASGCLTQPTSAAVDLAPALTGTYLSSFPVDPDRTGTKTYYYIKKSADGRIIVGACLAEAVDGNLPEIKVGR